jgi:hypothetical protein
MLDHFSEGKYDNVWMKETLKLHDKWNKILPVNVGSTSLEIAMKIEKNTFKVFIDQLLQFNYSIKTPLNMLSANKRFYSSIPLLFIKLKYYVLLKYLKAGKVR